MAESTKQKAKNDKKGGKNAAKQNVAARTGPKLVTLDGSREAAAFRQLVDIVFLPSQVVQPHERAYVIDLIKSALPQVTPEERLKLAQRLSKLGNSAKPLMQVLALDPKLEIAREIIASNAPLSDDELVGLALSGSPERRMLVARRPGLSTSVTSALTSTQDISAIFALLLNRQAVFSQPVLAACSQLARDHVELREPLLGRAELTPAVALDLFWVLGHHGRAHVLGRFLANDEIVKNTGSLETFGQVDDQAASSKNAGGLASSKNLKQCFFAEKIDKVISILAAGIHITGDAAHQIIMDPGGEPLAVACKAAGMHRSDFHMLGLRAANTHIKRIFEREKATGLVELFDRLSRGQARMAITYWNWRAVETGPYAPLRNDAPAGRKKPEKSEKAADAERSLPPIGRRSGYLSEIAAS